MTAADELRTVIAHIDASTGDPRAWTRGLTQDDIVTASMTSVLNETPNLGAVIDKIRANHPDLFDAKTGAPIQPRNGPSDTNADGQHGTEATALKKAETDLVQQNTSTSMLDLLVISAILNAHATNGAGVEKLRRLQDEIDEAVQNRTDLNTAAGARDFQRFLIGKLREISTLVESTDLDDRSQAALATAWSALYESSRSTAADTTESEPSAAGAGQQPDAAGSAELPAYGSDLPVDPYDDALLGLNEMPEMPLEPMPAPATMPPATPAAPTFPASAWMPASAGLPGPSSGGGAPAMPSLADDLAPSASRRVGPFDGVDDAALDRLLADELPTLDVDEGEAEDGAPTAGDGKTEAEEAGAEGNQAESGAPGSTVVDLPNGEQISAPTPELAAALRAALSGLPVVEAFHQQGIAVPPAGSPVPQPVDPANVAIGDVAMFTDRQGVALDRNRAWLNGQITPMDAVSGPSFLGWLHPPDPTKSGAAAPSDTAPAPTRPAVVAGHH